MPASVRCSSAAARLAANAISAGVDEVIDDRADRRLAAGFLQTAEFGNRGTNYGWELARAFCAHLIRAWRRCCRPALLATVARGARKRG